MRGLNICVLRTASDVGTEIHRKEKTGLLSYYARGNVLMSEGLSPEVRGDVMVISADGMDTHITPAIYDECRRRTFSSVFLDADEENRKVADILAEVSESLSRRGISVFCPLGFCDTVCTATPVAECAVSGGELSEYLAYLVRSHRRLALSIPRRCTEFSMPVFTPSGHSLSERECKALIERYGEKPHYSPQLAANYFIFSPENNKAHFVLFDDARTISEKIRIARRLGISDVFLAYREISDIYDDIMF